MAKVAKTPPISRERAALLVVVGRDEDRPPGVDIVLDIVVRLRPLQAGRIRATAAYLGHAKPRIVLGPELGFDKG